MKKESLRWEGFVKQVLSREQKNEGAI